MSQIVYGSEIRCETCNKKIITKLQYHWHSMRKHSLEEKIVKKDASSFTKRKNVQIWTKNFCFCGKCNVDEVEKDG